jgi:hypothetical protein
MYWKSHGLYENVFLWFRLVYFKTCSVSFSSNPASNVFTAGNIAFVTPNNRHQVLPSIHNDVAPKHKASWKDIQPLF